VVQNRADPEARQVQQNPRLSNGHLVALCALREIGGNRSDSSLDYTPSFLLLVSVEGARNDVGGDQPLSRR
jgi:hypothetical protein